MMFEQIFLTGCHSHQRYTMVDVFGSAAYTQGIRGKRGLPGKPGSISHFTDGAFARRTLSMYDENCVGFGKPDILLN